MGEIDSDAKDSVKPSNKPLPSLTTEQNEQTAIETSLFCAPFPKQIQDFTPLSLNESVDKAPQVCETMVSTLVEHKNTIKMMETH